MIFYYVGGTITVTGNGFVPLTIVALVNSITADRYEGDALFVDSQTIQVTFPKNVLSSGFYNLSATNGGGCNVTSSAQVEVRPILLVFYIDPPSIYNGISLSATIYTTGLNEEDADVLLINSATNQTITLNATKTDNSNKRNIVLPAGLDTGYWDVRYRSSSLTSAFIRSFPLITLSFFLSTIE